MVVENVLDQLVLGARWYSGSRRWLFDMNIELFVLFEIVERLIMILQLRQSAEILWIYISCVEKVG